MKGNPSLRLIALAVGAPWSPAIAQAADGAVVDAPRRSHPRRRVSLGTRIVAEGRLAPYPGAVTVPRGRASSSCRSRERPAERGDIVAQVRAEHLIAEIAAAEAKVGETAPRSSCRSSRPRRSSAKQIDASRRDRPRDRRRQGALDRPGRAPALQAKWEKYRVLRRSTASCRARLVDRDETVEAGHHAVVVDLARRVGRVDRHDRPHRARPVNRAEARRPGGRRQEIPDAVSARRGPAGPAARATRASSCQIASKSRRR
jgi:hypothetical protein